MADIDDHSEGERCVIFLILTQYLQAAGEQ